MAADTARLMDPASVRDGSDGGADMLSPSSASSSLSAAVTAPATAGGSARKDGRRLTPESDSDDGDDDEGGEESSGDDEGAKDGREWYEMREGLGEGSREQGHARRRRLLYTPDEERAVVRKFDRKLVVFMAVLYLLSFLDRSSTSISPPHRSHLH
jgi:hypothetical protein